MRIDVQTIVGRSLLRTLHDEGGPDMDLFLPEIKEEMTNLLYQGERVFEHDPQPIPYCPECQWKVVVDNGT